MPPLNSPQWHQTASSKKSTGFCINRYPRLLLFPTIFRLTLVGVVPLLVKDSPRLVRFANLNRFHTIQHVHTRPFISPREKSRNMRFNILSPGLSFEANLTLIVGILTVVGCADGLPVSGSETSSKTSTGLNPPNQPSSSSRSNELTELSVNFAGSTETLEHDTPAKRFTAPPLAYLTQEERETWLEKIEEVVKGTVKRYEYDLADKDINIITPSVQFPMPKFPDTERIAFRIPEQPGFPQARRGDIQVTLDMLLVRYRLGENMGPVGPVDLVEFGFKSTHESLVKLLKQAQDAQREALVGGSKAEKKNTA
ncbi:hypothetical protein EV360DRAFT_84869 [Lentinula raphanica]|nr:hypothetical protein EV360DRAFT_84869 [Lentinula raphanica]